MPSKSRMYLVAPWIAAALLATVVASPATAEWSRFRGPNGSGLSEATGLPVDFGPGLNVAWRTEVPFGRSSPAVGERHVFLTGIEGDQLLVLAIDRADGSVAWRSGMPRGHQAKIHQATDSATPSPVTDGTNVYAFFQEAGLVSYDAEGAERWRRPMGPFRNFYSVAASPILAGDRLIMLCEQSSGSYLLALNKDTGEELWRRERPNRREAYTTPILLDDGSILVSGSRWVDAYDPATGETRWELGGIGTSPIASPVLGGDLLFVATIDHGSSAPKTFEQLAAEYDANGDGELAVEELDGFWIQKHHDWVNNDGVGGISAADWKRHTAEVHNAAWGIQAVRLPRQGRKAEIAWSFKKNVPYVPTPLVLDDVFYMVADGILTSLDPATGEVIKRGRLTDGSPPVDASPIAAGGKLYIATRDGRVAVLTAGREWEVVGLNDLSEQIFATPAVDGDRLLVRTRGSLYAFATPPPEPEAPPAGR